MSSSGDAIQQNTVLNQTSNSNFETLICDSFQKTMWDNLFKFKNETLFTDICIYVDGVEFKCHKVILCAASSYFRAMFSCDLKESRLGKVYIENISPWTMKRLLDFIYTSKIEINHDTVIDIFNAAIMFNLYNLVEKCTIYIEEHIDITNCIDLYLFAELYNIEKLKEATFNFILENFMYIYELNHDYVKLNENAFVKLMKSENLNIPNEMYALQALKNWCLHASKQRDICLDMLFKLIRFKSINNDELMNLISNDSFIKENRHFINKALNNNCLLRIRPSTLNRDYLCVLNKNKFEIYDFYKSKWAILPNWPPNETENSVKLNAFSICIINNNLYLTGGIDLNINELIDLVWKYDASKNKWYKCMPMLNKRAYHLTLNLQSSTNELNNDYIFVFYGITKKRPTSLSANDNNFIATNAIEDLYEQCKIIEYYNINTDSWSELTLANTLSNYHLFQLNNQYDICRFILERDQLIRKKSIISLKNIIYILQSNSIHCYQFSSKQGQFICLPYFRLPNNLINNNFILLKAISIKAPTSSCLSLFTWADSTDDIEDEEDEKNELDEYEAPKKHEVLIFLANLEEKLIYEFYPARNKLKKLSNFLLKHSMNDTFLLKVKSHVYLTGGLIVNEELNDNDSETTSSDSVKYTAVEKYDYETDSWTIFMDCIENLNIENYDDNDELNFKFPLTNNLFKLKMSI